MNSVILAAIACFADMVVIGQTTRTFVPDLTAYRTGVKFGQPVSAAIEDQGNPEHYLVLINDDSEEQRGLHRRSDYDDDQALIPDPDARPLDDDLGRIVIHQLPARADGGSIQIVLSDPTSVRLFDDEGDELLQRNVDLAQLKERDVAIWFEGLKTDFDFTFAVVYRDPQGREQGRDEVHMLLGKWKQVGLDGKDRGWPVTVNSSILVSRCIDGDLSVEIPSASYFRNVLEGLPPDGHTLKQAPAADQTIRPRPGLVYHGRELTEAQAAQISAALNADLYWRSATGFYSDWSGRDSSSRIKPTRRKQIRQELRKLHAQLQAEPREHQAAPTLVAAPRPFPSPD